MKLKIDGLEAECSVEDAITILLALKEKEQKKYEGQPTWIIISPPAIQPPYKITYGGTYPALWNRELGTYRSDPTVGDRPYISSTSNANIKGMV